MSGLVFVSRRPKLDCHRVSMTVESRLDHVPLVCAMGRKLCELAEVDEMTAFNVELCISEIVANSLRHAYRGESGHEVEVDFEVTGEDFVIRVLDRGLPVPQENRAPKAIDFDPDDLDSVEEGGRGTFLVHTLMSSVEYLTEGDVNVVRMVKKLDLPPSSAAAPAAANG